MCRHLIIQIDAFIGVAGLYIGSCQVDGKNTFSTFLCDNYPKRFIIHCIIEGCHTRSETEDPKYVVPTDIKSVSEIRPRMLRPFEIMVEHKRAHTLKANVKA